MERSSTGLRRGAWCREEDDLLKACVQLYGEGKWHLVPSRAGLKRCRKSCRLRWLNYLKPNIKRGEFSEDEVDLMIRMHRLLGNRWSLIAGRLPGRTANDVKNYWNSKVRNKKQSSSFQKEPTNNNNSNSNSNNNNNNNNKNNIIAKPKETAAATTAVTIRPTTHQVIKPQPRTFSKTSPPPSLMSRIDSATAGCHQRQETDENITVDASASLLDLEDNNKGGNEENNQCCIGDDYEKGWNFESEGFMENEDLLIQGQSWSWSDLLQDTTLWDFS